MAQPNSYIIFDIQLQSSFTGKSITDAGVFNVLNLNGTTAATAAVLATIYDPDNNFAAVTQPKAIVEGKMRFAVLQSGGGQPAPPSVDITGITTKGLCFYRPGCTPGDVPNFFLDGNERDQTAMIPYSFAQAGANVEFDTGWQLPANAYVEADPAVDVVVVDSASETIAFGVLGTSTGFATGISTATAGTIKASLTYGSVTMGSLLKTVAGTGSTLPIPEGYVVSAAIDVSYKLAASTASGSGFLMFDFRRPVN
jgi:hypothetical protein